MKETLPESKGFAVLSTTKNNFKSVLVVMIFRADELNITAYASIFA